MFVMAGMDDVFWYLDILLEHIAIQKNNGAEGLVVGGSRNGAFDSQIGNEILNFGSIHFQRVTLFVKKYKAFDPIDIALLCAIGIMFYAKDIAHLIEQFFTLLG